ncbi:hypothetical protein PILCRDRAFT_818191 [Piloderma croceum F 1598]|uniref:NAD(P)-binding protein n=1 Tax=Piloderma croceum (strain F 1598) TaxID=765440 RepID=A0A0C3FY75_PILCF|nr:hypothetical protein PILCRDRAFT_818191 [Piloderma croceum F 1598]
MASIGDSKCVLVIGATAGIGRSLALSILSLPSKPTVVVAGRRKDRLDQLHKEHGHDGRLATIQMDIDVDRITLRKTVEDVIALHPKLDTIIFSAGVQHQFDWTKPKVVNFDNFASELNTNYTAVITMITYFLPHLLKLGSSGQHCFIVPITSGLAIIPSPSVSNYSATKAALHSFGISLSVQLSDTNVHVMEIMPPLVESELHDHQGTTPKLSKIWMPLDEFTVLAMDGLKRGDLHIPIGAVQQRYDKFEEGKVDVVNAMFNPRKT